MAASSRELDLTSPDFDPYKALYSSSVSVPVQSAQSLDNLDAYDAIRRGVRAPQPSEKEKKAEERPQTLQRAFLPHQMPIHVPRRVLPNLLSRMKNFQGPLAALFTYVEQGRRLRVWTRDMCGVRGVMTATLVAFDKHWNLAMIDVDEYYVRRRTGVKVPATGDELASSMSRLRLDSHLPDSGVKPDQPWALLLAAPDLSRRQSSESGQHMGPSTSTGRMTHHTTGTPLARTRKWTLVSRHMTQVMLRGEQVAIVAPTTS